jgi:hypothetical protein
MMDSEDENTPRPSMEALMVEPMIPRKEKSIVAIVCEVCACILCILVILGCIAYMFLL